MDTEEFRRRGKEMIDYVADYLENIRDRPVYPEIEQGYLRKLIPAAAPQQPESWNAVFQDIERVIMPGVTHWHSPRFHAYFPCGNSWPGILADILSDAIGCIGFSWAASPACTELETVMMDWLAQLLGLPEHFMFSSKGPGGGVIQGTASEACYVALLAAKSRAIRNAKPQYPDLSDEEIASKLICYESEQAHTAAERAAMLAFVKCRPLSTDQDLSLRGEVLEIAINEDKGKGLIPFYVLATLGTTGCCAFDNLKELGAICQAQDIWLHVDAAYAGSAFICPEFRSYLEGVELADSFNFNPHKWMLVNFDCSALWLRDSSLLVRAFMIDLPILIKQPEHGEAMPDYRHWQIALGRRFRSLKLWFIMRLYGVEGLQKYIREQVNLAHEFERMVNKDGRFEIVIPVRLGLACFRLRLEDDSDKLNEKLLDEINKTRLIHLTHTKVHGRYVIRFAICSRFTNLKDIEYSWHIIQKVAESVLQAEAQTSNSTNN
ncbi:aromatic-L-amino-acid decarboxylase-like [Paramacrobiotus metropolitanus]|uniref:aromatic-L-amino-acid decarboxylase-like n=1 Tax=Paramacrobiotus metropolitanus TaxID=2943436 RepID=UPI0024462D5A|nr:aromatic-L-amino-acid decarboxylase-like [Paramacrobiotus metropolitanus]XP_055357203.1 aromatic-L-amino-acid decarboxylase-like [Paramacrobiotus metropolitanus]XP_055357210.1 aromatic-L-amino-acid decarboxylase-like [Paramacrobiotus metropolitanus]XP_055357216.1 aromatic-L-amino-acid decarboxylase-like [Paramacrobiotus metropolitanus]